MRILCLTSRLPYPPHRGDRVRTYNFIRAFSEHHEVDLLSFVRDRREAGLARELRDLANVETVTLGTGRSLGSMAVRALSPLPYQALYYRSPAMAARCARALAGGGYDLLYAHLFRTAPFVEPALRARRGSRPIAVLDLTDAIAAEIDLSIPHRPPALRPAYRWESAKIRRYERRVAPLFDEVWTISRADAEETRRHAPDAAIAVVPNGVEETLFDLAPPEGEPGVLFVGNLSIAHNVDALGALARDIMPLVQASVPGARLSAAGSDATPAVERLARESGVELVGYLPELRDIYGIGGVFAAPLRFAAGVQNKILEAMAAGLPVVTTSVANRGLGARDGREILVRDAPEAFASAVVGLLRDRAARSALGGRGREFVRKRFRWSLARERIESLVARDGTVASSRPSDARAA